MIFTLDEDLEIGSWLDLGIFIGALTIAARGRGLDTCPQAAFADFHTLIRPLLGIPANQIRAAPAEHEAEESAANDLRFRAKGFGAHRKRLGLSAAQAGALIGVSGQTIYHWEAGKAKPRASQMERIAALRKLSKKRAAAAVIQVMG